MYPFISIFWSQTWNKTNTFSLSSQYFQRRRLKIVRLASTVLASHLLESVCHSQYSWCKKSVFTSVICLVFDLVYSKTPLFPKETLINHFYVWSSFASLWFCLFENTHIYEKRSCDTQLLCVCVCQANEYRANGTEVIMYKITALWFLPLLWAAFTFYHYSKSNTANQNEKK